MKASLKYMITHFKASSTNFFSLNLCPCFYSNTHHSFDISCCNSPKCIIHTLTIFLVLSLSLLRRAKLWDIFCSRAHACPFICTATILATGRTWTLKECPPFEATEFTDSLVVGAELLQKLPREPPFSQERHSSVATPVFFWNTARR